MTDPRCKRIFALLSDYLDGELPSSNCRELQRHLRGCKPCIAYIESLKTAVLACRNYEVRQIPRPSPRVRAALLKAIHK